MTSNTNSHYLQKKVLEQYSGSSYQLEFRSEDWERPIKGVIQLWHEFLYLPLDTPNYTLIIIHSQELWYKWERGQSFGFLQGKM